MWVKPVTYGLSFVELFASFERPLENGVKIAQTIGVETTTARFFSSFRLFSVFAIYMSEMNEFLNINLNNLLFLN